MNVNRRDFLKAATMGLAAAGAMNPWATLGSQTVPPMLDPSQMSPAQLLQRTATPALFAQVASQGRWIMAPHLAKLDRAITDTLLGVDGIRRLIVTMPPRHGKSELCSKYLPGWVLGTFPDWRVILSSYGDDFASDWGRKARTLLEEWGPQVFGVQVARSPAAANKWNIDGRDGGMQTAGVGGPITGKGAHLLIIDDPVKNSEEAKSEVYRAKTWEWYQTTAYTRLTPNGCVIVIQTRWHEDDLTGRLLKDMADGGEQWRVVNMPAINSAGEALWPEQFSLKRLLSIKRTLGTYNWNALYQQTPTAPEGGVFKRAWFPIVPAAPAWNVRAVRYWDKAATEGDGDFTVGVLLVESEGRVYVADVVRGQWSSFTRDKIIGQTCELDKLRYPNVKQRMEEEGGSSGKDVAREAVRKFARYGMRPIRSTGDKEHRAEPFAARAEAGDVCLVSGAWNTVYLDELASFPNGTHDDQVDGSSGAYNELACKGSFAVGA